MTVIEARTTDQVLSAVILPKIAPNNVDSVKLSVTFDSFWDGYGKSAIFFTSENPTMYEVPLSANDECYIPVECLVKSAYLIITLKGVKNGSTKSSLELRCKISKGTPSVIVSEPTRDVYSNILANYGSLKQAVDRLTARVNGFIALEDGSTTGDAELANARIDADGNTHATAGDATREQVSDVREGVSKENLFDFDKVTAGYFTTDGVLHNAAITTNYFRWELASDYIPVIPSETYMLSIVSDRSVAGWYCVCTYDNDKNFISRAYVYEFTDLEYSRKYTFAEGVAYVRISYRSHMDVKIKFEKSRYISKEADEVLKNNIVDSRPLMFDGYIVDNGSIYPPTDASYSDAGHAFEEKYSRHIPVTAGEEYTLYCIAEKYPWFRVGFYNSEGRGISTFTGGNGNKFEFTVPDGAISMMLSARTYYLIDFALFKKTQVMSAEQKTRENYLELIERNKQINSLSCDTIKSINHRGYCTVAPENTLSAFKLSKQEGFKYVECDVSFTSDGVAVLLHDSTIDRTSNGTGNIADLTFSDVRALDFGSWKSEEYAGEQIPTFEEFIALCKHLGLHPYIELKTGTESQIKALVDVVKRYGIKGKVTWISFNATYLSYVKAVDPRARLGFVVDTISTSTINTIKNNLRSGYNEVFVDSNYGTLTSDNVQLCINEDVPLEVWTVNSENAILTLNAYVSGVTSDNLIASDTLYNNSIGG